MTTDPLSSGSLVDGLDLDDPAPTASLAEAFGVPPFSVLDRRAGRWQARRRRWLDLGLASGVGRDERLTYGKSGGTDEVSMKLHAVSGGTSTFDPVITELSYRWHTNPGDRILDPFAGGSVRGIVAAVLGRDYVGIDLRPEQIAENETQRDAILVDGDTFPRWIVGDSLDLREHVGVDYEADFVFSCPPYADLEVYSDDPRDLSTMSYADFNGAHRAIIQAAFNALHPDRFAAWVIGDVRDKRGAYRGLVSDTIRAFVDAGFSFHNEAIILDPAATSALRAERPFRASRKLTRTHQHYLTFVKGDAKKAADRLGDLGEMWSA